jgi:hypothetical protein
MPRFTWKVNGIRARTLLKIAAAFCVLMGAATVLSKFFAGVERVETEVAVERDGRFCLVAEKVEERPRPIEGGLLTVGFSGCYKLKKSADRQQDRFPRIGDCIVLVLSSSDSLTSYPQKQYAFEFLPRRCDIPRTEIARLSRLMLSASSSWGYDP